MVGRLVYLSLVMIAGICHAQGAPVVAYPDLRQPYAKLFDDIVRGVEEGYGSSIKRVKVGSGVSALEAVGEGQANAVVALGQSVVNDLSGKNLDIPIVAGAVGGAVDGNYGVTIVPDLGAIAKKLPLLVPWINEVHVVAQTKDLLRQLAQAETILAAQNIKLIVHSANDVRQAATFYQRLADELSRQSALWILPTGSYANDAVLAMLLERSWKRDFVIFSSTPGHIGRGVLFCIYPDNYRMGVTLGEILRAVEEGSLTEPRMSDLTELFVAFNERTARHLGVKMDDRLRQQIDLLVPVR